TGVGEGDREGA
ncbi:hypothetical protein A2U01_0098597, partial [Trifolium medium]|nr:hypothetical protein [Trifolium medium]